MKLIQKAAEGVFHSDKSLFSFLTRINSMDFLSEHLFNQKKNEMDQQREKFIMNAPLLKLYTKRSSGAQMESANLALSAEEQMNLMQLN